MIVCIQLGLPLPVLIAEIVVILKTNSMYFISVEMNCFIIPLLGVNTILDLICILLLVVWVCMLWKRRLLRSKVTFVCTQISHILIILVVFLIGNILFVFSESFDYGHVVVFAIRTVVPVSFDVYILISLQNMQNTKAQVPATNCHTNPPSTRVSLPTDTAEHAPNFLSRSTAEPSEVTPLVNN